MKQLRRVVALILVAAPGVAGAGSEWREVECVGAPHARHEAGFVASGNELVLLGGRRVQPVDVLDPSTLTWRAASRPPLEIHHFQPVVWGGKIYLPGAMTGRYPGEVGLDHVPIYDVTTDAWSRGPAVPEDRRRGAAGAVVVGDDLYVVGGIVDGHRGGYVAWLDRVNLRSGKWTRLADAPHARDHFQAAVIDGKLYAAGGRTTSQATGQTFELTVAPVDVYDLATGEWLTLAEPLPTPRAGNATFAHGGRLVVVGGESGTQRVAHAEVEAFDPRTGEWAAWPALQRGRHGTGVAWWGGRLWIASGSGNRGGGPELTSVEVAEVGP